MPLEQPPFDRQMQALIERLIDEDDSASLPISSGGGRAAAMEASATACDQSSVEAGTDTRGATAC
jgi:hypothetical protein